MWGNIAFYTLWAIVVFAPAIIVLVLSNKNRTLSTASKVAWVLCCIFTSWLGLIIYLAVNQTVKDHLDNQNR